MMLLSSTGFVFANEEINDLETVQIEENVERTSLNGVGWVKRGDSLYYNNENGKPVTGWKMIGPINYYFHKDGKMASGWTEINRRTYYFSKEKGMHTGIQTLENGKTYNFGKNGFVGESIVRQNGKILYFNERGKLTSTGKSYKSNASAYSGHSTTATGQKPKWGTIAVDPKVIPYGTKVYIPYFNKTFVANDCGGAIKGTKIDIFMNSRKECYKFGRRNIEIIVLNDIK